MASAGRPRVCFDDEACSAGTCRVCSPAPRPARTADERRERLQRAIESGIFDERGIQILSAALDELPATVRTRTRAIAFALWFGLAPSWVYEARCHYAPSMSYLQHLAMNFAIALAWATWRDTPELRRFERVVNAHPLLVRPIRGYHGFRRREAAAGALTPFPRP